MVTLVVAGGLLTVWLVSMGLLLTALGVWSR